jgi:uncharacterized protein (TIGR02271 family)
MDNTVVAVYDNYEEANKACQALLDAGFSRADTQLSPSSESLGTDTGSTAGATVRSASEETGIGHFFRSLFGMEDDREQRDIYAESVRRGSYILTANAQSEEQADQATSIMNSFGPVDIEERSSQWKSQGWTGYDESAPMYTRDEIEKDRSSYLTAGKSGETKIPVIQEELKLGKRAVQRGGVRIFQRVEETPVHESVSLHDEKVKVERRPVDQPASEADLAAFKEGAIEVSETTEEPVVSKTARVVEEVAVRKEGRDRTETVDDTVRKTNVDVEQIGASGTATPAATTTARMGGTTATSLDDDRDFRSHWQTSYGSQGGRYEDYGDAYRYGSSIAANDRYRNRQWADIEPDLRGDWESRHPESTWEKVKDAVRYGSERVTGRSR